MKGLLNITCILEDFWKALVRGFSSFQVFLVVATFFVLPLTIGVFTHAHCVKIPAEQFSSLISVYAIFSALLFGAQISAFSIFRSLTEFQQSRINPNEEDSVLKASVEVDVEQRIANLKLAFKDINSNISYLIMTSVVLLSILVVFSVSESAKEIASSVVISLTAHLILVLTMVVKQCLLIFNAAYSD
jgi:hypothetical protein